MGQKNQTNRAMRVSLVTILGNLLLTAFKLSAGVLAHSGAMVSDAVHSASDVLSTLVVMAGIRLSGKASDQRHPYGHERLECVAALLLAVVLGLTGAAIGWEGLRHIAGHGALRQIPGRLALAAAVVSILTKEGMYWYTRSAAQALGSSALMADAWHHRSDALSSVGSFAGILGARLGFPLLDPAASLVICLFIGKAAWGIFRDAVAKMVDTACPEILEEEMRQVALGQEGVLQIDRFQTRLFGDRVYVEMDIAADSRMSFPQAHAVSDRVHDAIEDHFPSVKHCMVHVSPLEIAPSRAYITQDF